MLIWPLESAFPIALLVSHNCRLCLSSLSRSTVLPHFDGFTLSHPRELHSVLMECDICSILCFGKCSCNFLKSWWFHNYSEGKKYVNFWVCPSNMTGYAMMQGPLKKVTMQITSGWFLSTMTACCTLLENLTASSCIYISEAMMLQRLRGSRSFQGTWLRY